MKTLVVYLFFCVVIFNLYQSVDGQEIEKVDFQDLIMNPTQFDGKYIRLEGVYSGYEEPLVFMNLEDFKNFKNRNAVLIKSKAEDLPENRCHHPQHGKAVIVSGKFRVVPDEFFSVFLGELVDLQEFRAKEKGD